MSITPTINLSPDSGAALGGGAGLHADAKPKIHGFASAPMEHSDSKWKRPPNKTGAGATHVRTFQGKMSGQGLEFLDRHVNEWLDAHPEVEVKFSTMTVGEVATATGREQIAVVQIWV